ncbi:MAG TPA: PDZ domain-containing protein [Synergistaceae bacterium]|nr:PDZ domain-containing protein [Synergistaceae bacterium]
MKNRTLILKIGVFLIGLFLFAAPTPIHGVENITLSIQDFIIQRPDETRIYTNSFSDSKITIQLRLSWFSILARITNTTNDVQSVSWGKSAYIDVDGNSRKIVPGETLLIDMSREIPDTVIPPRASTEIMIFPHGYWQGERKPWKMLLDYPYSSNLFGVPSGLKGKKTKSYSKFAQKYEGRSVGLMLCITTPGKEDFFYNLTLGLDFAKGIDAPLKVEEENGDVSPIVVGLTLKETTIEMITKNSLSEKVGLQRGDIILEVNGRSVSEIPNLQTYIEQRVLGGRSVMLTYERSGKQGVVTIKKSD